MDVAERPVLVAPGGEIGDRARGVGLVGGVAGAGGVQDAEIEPARHGCRVGQRQVLLDRPALEAAAVDGDPQGVEAEGAGTGGREDVHGGRQGDRAGDDALGVVVAADQDRRDAGAVEARHLPGEEQADRGVGPVAVVDIAGHHHEGHRPLDRLGDQILEGLPPGRGEPAREIRVPGREARQRAAEMQIRRVDEAERSHRSPGRLRWYVGTRDPERRSGSRRGVLGRRAGLASSGLRRQPVGRDPRTAGPALRLTSRPQIRSRHRTVGCQRYRARGRARSGARAVLAYGRVRAAPGAHRACRTSRPRAR